MSFGVDVPLNFDITHSHLMGSIMSSYLHHFLHFEYYWCLLIVSSYAVFVGAIILVITLGYQMVESSQQQELFSSACSVVS